MMASSSSLPCKKRKCDAFLNCLPGSSDGSNTSIMASLPSRTWKYDVFLSFRGEDTHKTFVDYLYHALAYRVSCIYKDDVTLDSGYTIGPSLLNAIQESQIALIIFSEYYAYSSRCLDELAYIMKCKEEIGQIVIPIFYNVDPSDVREQKGQFGKAFAKHDLVNNHKVESWRKALFDASNIARWEPNQIANGHEAVGIKIIVGTIMDKLLSVNTYIDEKLVGMGPRIQNLESQLQIGSHGVRMIGIWGVGGGGKTTLAFSVYMKIRDHFKGHCFIGNIREEVAKHGLQKLQEKFLSKILKKQVSLNTVPVGKCMIKSMLRRRNLLIVLDDVDDYEQLEALAGSHDWFGEGSRIIITTRDEHLLTTHRVDKVCPLSLLSDHEAYQLFKTYAYQENNPIEDYDKLSFRVIYYVKGLPLALKILGSFLYGKDKNEWISALHKLREIPQRKVTDQLKISYDGLEHDEKQIFLDIVCFFKGKSQDKVIGILDACGFHSSIGMKVLRQKALITISSNGKVDMHDLVQEMGHHIVRGEHPNNPEKHSRVWKTDEITSMLSQNATTENDMIEAIQYVRSVWDGFCLSDFIKFVSNMKKLRFLDVTFYDYHKLHSYDEGPTFLSNELKYIGWSTYCARQLPLNFIATKLVVLKLYYTSQKELWKGCKLLPCLKELEVYNATHLVRMPDFGGLPCLQKLTLVKCDSLEDIDPSLGNHSRLVYIFVSSCRKLRTFPTIVWMSKLKSLTISTCFSLCEFPRIVANMDSLVNLCLARVGIRVLPSSVGRCCTNLISLQLENCSNLQCIEGNFRTLKHLQKFELTSFTKLQWFPKDLFDEKCFLEELCFDLKYWAYNVLPPSPPHLPRLLRKLNLSSLKLKDGEIPCEIGELSNLQELHLCRNYFSRLDFSIFQFTRLKLLNVSDCNNLVELPELPSNLSILHADDCDSLEAIKDDVHRNCKWLCQVSIAKSYGFCSFVGGERLFETMLQGKASCMSMELKGLEIPKGFKPRLVKGCRYRLKLPENWFNEFSGFLFCCVWKKSSSVDSVKITMRQEEQLLQMGVGDSQDEQVIWGEEIYLNTWIGYVSFGSLRCTTWWDNTSTAVDVSIDLSSHFENSLITGFGARLVSTKNQVEETTTTTNHSCADDDYKCKFNILRDSRSCIECQFKLLIQSSKWLEHFGLII